MKSFLPLILSFLMLLQNLSAQKEIRLIVRADDIGSSHNANLACIQSYKEGIVKSVEIMVPCPWFLEAVKMLKENPGYDVGVHLVLTSEWENYKWRPLTYAPTLIDADGYFYPMIWPGENFKKEQSLSNSQINMKEVEKELRAQIEMAMKYIPNISHLSNHMGWTSISPEMKTLYEKLAKEYELEIDMSKVESAGKYYQNKPELTAEQNFIAMLESLKPGTYLYVEHPGLNNAESKAVFHKGYETVCTDRQTVTDVFTSPAVKDAIVKNKIQLIAYKDLKK